MAERVMCCTFSMLAAAGRIRGGERERGLVVTGG